MARFNFREGFFLNLGGDILSPTKIRFEAGEQDVPDDLADHWFLAEMGERIDPSEPAEPAPVGAPAETIAETDAKEALRAEAAALGVPVDKRWGADRLRAEIEAKKATGEPAPVDPPSADVAPAEAPAPADAPTPDPLPEATI